MTATYLAGPMSGLEGMNFPAFHAAAAKLRAEGRFVFNPAEASIETSDYRMCMIVNLTWIACHAQAIAMLPGWENSRGARAEKALADAIGLEIIYLA